MRRPSSTAAIRFWQGLLLFGLIAVTGCSFFCVTLRLRGDDVGAAVAALGIIAGAVVAVLARIEIQEARDARWRLTR